MEVPIPSSGYPDSVDSSPRSRGGESWDEPFPSPGSAAASGRLRLMCSYGGRIVPRPTDKSLCYLGGETRIVAVDRHCSIADFHSRLARALPLPASSRPFLIKYQLPSEDLDALISVATDEDLENMVEEHDRLGRADPPRSSRLRLFIFSAAAAVAGYSGSALVDDAKSEAWFVDALNGAVGMATTAASGGGGFFSADSASVNSLLGLDEASSAAEAEQIALQIKDPGVEERFANIRLSPAAPPPLPTSLGSPPGENSSRAFSDDERPLQANPSSGDPPMPRQSMLYEEIVPPKLEIPPGHGPHRVQIQVPDQLHKQFIPPSTQFVQMPSYYPVAAAHPMQHPQQVYYLPIQQQNPVPPQAYNLGVQASPLSDATASMKPVMPVANTSLPVASQLIHVPSDQSHGYTGLGYQFVHQHPGQPTYGYEYTDPNQNQMQFYYAQSGASAMPPQYQATNSVSSVPSPSIHEPQPVELQQGRGSS